MASPRKIVANRRNAQHSTGPRTAKGKSRSKRNALRHGLAVTLPTIGASGREVERLASAIAGQDSDPCRRYFAVMAAEAELELRRVRAVRLSSLIPQTPAGSPPPDSQQKTENLAATLPNLLRLDRYERRALSRRNRALRQL
jgi:hypothetical protein